MTLSKVTVHLSKDVKEGQDYVTLSRAKSLDSPKVITLGHQQCGLNYEVLSFLEAKFRPKKRICIEA